ncbi:MFS family permease [Streptomyces sp. SAI-144]|uniref:MFS transporter n=1 Tax=unclassified Streptomyces TaxID=2593676 RepID=UPI0024754192|nr:MULTISPECIES: MFS transporter [unclassified Streptomyces]MDH6435244.1 MFS family permease [Streptomyces sp. SAI-144]MDH6489305.1 MFS family permease [Streptomyces sp. SAI-127]
MTYRDVASPQVLVWACTSVGARMPVAMAPLALVFLVRERPGGYALGAVLAAAYVIGEIVGAPVLGLRLPPERARPQLAVGLTTGALGFAGLGVFPDAPSLVLGAFAFLAGATPAAATGGLRALLTELVPERAVAQALSTESMLNSVIWAVSPAAVAGLALQVAPHVPLLLAAALMAASVAGLWLLPAGWKVDDSAAGAWSGGSLPRLLLGAWPVYVAGAASLSLLGLAELVLPALLEQRGIPVGWSGPLLTGLAVGAGLGAFLYGLRTWPGLLRTRSVVLMCGTSICVTLIALTPNTAGIATALAVGGLLQSGALLTRNLALRDALPPGALAAGYSVMYAAAGAGYAATGSLAGALLKVTVPSTAVLAGVALTLVLTGIGWWGEARRTRSSAQGADAVVVPGRVVGELAPGAEGTAIGGRCDAEGRL